MTQPRPWSQYLGRARHLQMQFQALIAMGLEALHAVCDLGLRFWLSWAVPQIQGVAATPKDLRPVDLDQGKAILAGNLSLSGGQIEIGPDGNPWSMTSPSRQFATALHQFVWLNNLVALGAEGRLKGLQLVLGWQREFGRWNRFAWDRSVLERRVYAFACQLGGLAKVASDLEIGQVCKGLLRQAHYLMAEPGPSPAERATLVAIAACALKGPNPERLLARALGRLVQTLPVTVLSDGGHVSRSPEAAMALLLDLLSLDDGLSQRGQAAPAAVTLAISRLTQAMRFFTLPDGRLASFQGGEAGDRAMIAAARAHDDQDLDPKLPQQARQSGYQRLQIGALTVMVDVGAPIAGPWSQTACAQPLALEIVCGRDRLVMNGGWSPRLTQADAYRLTPAGSTACLGQSSTGQVLQGPLANKLGPRLVGGSSAFQFRRREAESGILLEASHDGWVSEFGLFHERRIFLRRDADELRGEDYFFRRQDQWRQIEPGRAIRLDVYFHLHPNIRASLAQDRRSVLLLTLGAGGWRLRSDAAVINIEQGVQFMNGLPRRTSKIVLRDSLARQGGGKIRWKLDRTDTDRGAGAS